jgi:hypothetical protein
MRVGPVQPRVFQVVKPFGAADTSWIIVVKNMRLEPPTPDWLLELLN